MMSASFSDTRARLVSLHGGCNFRDIGDYLLTNQPGDFEKFLRSRNDAQLGLTDIHHPLLSMPDDIRRVLFSAHAEFLQAAFERIEDLGGIDDYLERTAGVTATVREAVARELSE